MTAARPGASLGNLAHGDTVERVMELTDGLGVPATFELCTELVRPGGHVANLGVQRKTHSPNLSSRISAPEGHRSVPYLATRPGTASTRKGRRELSSTGGFSDRA